MPLVTHGIAVRMQRHAELQAEHGREPGRHVDRQGGRMAAFGPGDKIMPDVGAAPDFPKAEAAGTPGVGKAVRGPISQGTATAGASLRCSLSNRHTWIIVRAAYLSLIRPAPSCRNRLVFAAGGPSTDHPTKEEWSHSPRQVPQPSIGSSVDHPTSESTSRTLLRCPSRLTSPHGRSVDQ